MSLKENNEDSNLTLIDIIIDSDKKLLTELLVSEEMKSKINIKLNNNEILVITNILKYAPEFLNHIEKSVIEIVKDNRIDTNDIPNLIILIQNIYELLHKLDKIKIDDKNIADVCGNVLKFIIHVMVEERKIKIQEDKKNEFLALADKLVDSCISLINFSKLLKRASCLKKLCCML
jgi:hypothetical protein